MLWYTKKKYACCVQCVQNALYFNLAVKKILRARVRVWNTKSAMENILISWPTEWLFDCLFWYISMILLVIRVIKPAIIAIEIEAILDEFPWFTHNCLRFVFMFFGLSWPYKIQYIQWKYPHVSCFVAFAVVRANLFYSYSIGAPFANKV